MHVSEQKLRIDYIDLLEIIKSYELLLDAKTGLDRRILELNLISHRMRLQDIETYLLERFPQSQLRSESA